MKQSDMTKVEEYWQLEKKLLEIREAHNGEESLEEENLLDEMDALWYSMSWEEQNEINSAS